MNKNRQPHLPGTLFLALLITLVIAMPAEAIRNVCRNCQTRAELTDIICPNCGQPMNVCLSCNHQNPVSADYCLVCFEPLAESRLLGTIASDVREELRLGQSPRAEIERELSKLDFLLQTKPENRQIYLFRRGKLYHQMQFFSREAQTWEEFLKDYPESPKKKTALAFRSEALRQWGYLIYTQKNLKEALVKFEEAATCNPGNIEAWIWVGRVRNELGNREGAKDAYQQILNIDPKNATAKHFHRQLSANGKAKPKATK